MRAIDIHTHLELNLPGVPPNRFRKKPPRLFMHFNELLKFRSIIWKNGNYPELVRMLISLDNQVRLSMASRDNLLREMDSSGVSVSVTMPIEPYVKSKDYLNEIADEPRLLTFASAHPDDKYWQNNLKEAMNSGCRGVKIHPILQELHPENEFYFQLLEEFRQYGRPVLTHSGEFEYFIPQSRYREYGGVFLMKKLISSFPDVPFILGHMGLYDAEGALKLAAGHENVYLETSFQSAATIKRALNTVGKDRVVFGSDWPESRQHVSFKIARMATRTQPHLQEKILWENAESLIGPVQWESIS